MEDNYDKLDEFFRRQMSDSTPDPSWNVPDDSLFESAIAEVHHAQKGFNWKRLLIVVPFLFLGTLGIYEYQKEIAYDQLKSELTSLQDEVEALNASVQTMQGEIDDQELQVTNLKTENMDLQQELSDVNGRLNGSVRSQQVLSNKLNKSLLSAGVLSDQVKLLKDQLDEVQIAALATQASSSKDVLTINAIPALAFGPIALLNNNIDPISIKAQSLTSIPNKNKFNPAWSIGADAVINNSWVTMTDLPSTEVEQLGGYKNANTGFGTQVMMEYQATPRWSFNGGLAYNRFENRSSFEASFFFDTKYIEQDDSGNDVYVVELEMKNPYGDYDSEATFRVSQDMRQNCLVEEFTQVRQKLDVVTLSAGAKYRLIDQPKYGIYVGAGLGVNAITFLRNEFDVSLVMASTLRHNYRDVTYDMDGLNRVYATGSLSAGFNYKINDRLSFNLEGQYNKGLTSIRDSWPNSGPNTFVQNVASNIGLRYRLD